MLISVRFDHFLETRAEIWKTKMFFGVFEDKKKLF